MASEDVDLTALIIWSLLRRSASGDDLTALQSSSTSGLSSAGIPTEGPNGPKGPKGALSGASGTFGVAARHETTPLPVKRV